MERFRPAETTHYEVAQYDYLTMPCAHKGRHTENVFISWYREQSWRTGIIDEQFESEHFHASNDKDGRFYTDSKGKNLALRKNCHFQCQQIDTKIVLKTNWQRISFINKIAIGIF